MKYFRFFLLAILSALLVQCDFKDIVPEGELEIEESSDFFRVELNGNLLEANVTAAHPNENEIRIGSLNDSTNQSIGFIIREEGLGESIYELKDTDFTSRFAHYMDLNGMGGCDYNRWVDQSVVYSGFLKIEELNTVDKKIVGRFAFSIESDNCEKVELEKGYFKVHY